MSKSLSEFLSTPKHTKAREQLLESKLVYDLMLAAANKGYGLLSYKSATDTDGFDVVLDDRKTIIPIQLKTVLGSTNEWKIHRTLIKPTINDLETHELHATHRHVGRAGGIMLSKITINGHHLNIDYYYSDFLIIELICHKFINLPKKQSLRIDKLRRDLIDEAQGKVAYPFCAFVKLKSPDELLAIAGLQSKSFSFWRGYFQEYLRFKNIQDFKSYIGEADFLMEDVKLNISKLIY